ncbi:MAG: hypothetical protein Q9220_005398 [cf. Caloplaca sp. 1 TL-2023]
MKKLFHRKKASAPSSPEQTPPRKRQPESVNTDPNLRTSRYETTSSAGMPQTGQYPMKGNNSSVALQGRRSDTYSRGQSGGGVEPSPRPSSSNPYYGSLPTPRVTSASYDQPNSGYPFTEQLPSTNNVGNYQHRQEGPSGGLPIQDFSNLNLNSPANQQDNLNNNRRQHGVRDTTVPAPADSSYPSSRHERQPHEMRSNEYDNAPSVRMVGNTTLAQPDREQPYQDRNMRAGDYSKQRQYGNDYNHPDLGSTHGIFKRRQGFSELMKKGPISRKEVANVPSTSTPTPSQPTTLSSKHMDGNRSETFPSSGAAPRYRDQRRPHPEEYMQNTSNVSNISHENTRSSRPSAQEVIDRARGNTYDTSVVEKVAPAVVHETVHQDVHHVREEVITQEIHTHDVYHRILPVIDVEVLPPRHFLPVEGGGLVEISGKEVPGRGNNWVIAETASKIPSDQAAPKGFRNFTARQFPGTEGDAMRYKMPDGHEKTEQTWVHPPVLETGGRDTGQTWPMEFGTEALPQTNREGRHSKPAMPKQSRRL